jgi:Fur family ferric uptake transcriptional regulator
MNTTTLFKEKEIKNTPARIAIINLLKKTKKPIDVGEIIEKLNKMKIKIDRVTVFRNINLLVEKKVIEKVEFDEGKYRYELSSLAHHHHLVCVDCKKVIDIKTDKLHEKIDDLSKQVNTQHNFVIEKHRLEFFGKCKTCKNK